MTKEIDNETPIRHTTRQFALPKESPTTTLPACAGSSVAKGCNRKVYCTFAQAQSGSEKNYFPIQKVLKICLSTSSGATAPVMPERWCMA